MLLNFDELYSKYLIQVRGVIHIGAHYGEEHSIYEKYQIENITYFEPLKKNFEVLKNNIKDRAQLFNIALGNEDKDVEMFVESVNKGMSSSILKPELHLSQYPWIKFTEKEVVKMKRLDDLGLDVNNYNFINIDVQGYELEVFKGAKNFLNSIDYIISEVNRDEVYQNCTKVDELDKFLATYGFIRKETSWDGYTWGDAFYIKEKK